MLIRAISILQPMAWGIEIGLKRVENRTWGTAHRGLIGIHAATSRRYLAKGWEQEDTAYGPHAGQKRFGEVITFGAIVAVATLRDCVPLAKLPKDLRKAADSLFDPCGPICWILDDIQPLRSPYPCKGKQQLWSIDLPDSVLKSAELATL